MHAQPGLLLSFKSQYWWRDTAVQAASTNFEYIASPTASKDGQENERLLAFGCGFGGGPEACSVVNQRKTLKPHPRPPADYAHSDEVWATWPVLLLRSAHRYKGMQP